MRGITVHMALSMRPGGGITVHMALSMGPGGGITVHMALSMGLGGGIAGFVVRSHIRLVFTIIRYNAAPCGFTK